MKRWLRRLRNLLLVLLLLAVVAFFAIPALVSGSWGRDRIAGALADQLGVEVRLGEVDFGWFSGFVVDDVAVGEGEDALRVRRLAVHPEMLSLLGDEIRLDRVEIEGIAITLVREIDGRWTMPGWPEPTARSKWNKEKDASKPGSRRSITGEIAVRDAEVRLRDAASGSESTISGAFVEGALEADGSIRGLRLGAASPAFTVEGEAGLLRGLRLRKAPSFVGRAQVDDLALAKARSWLPDGVSSLDGRASMEIEVEYRDDALRVPELAVDVGGATIRGQDLGLSALTTDGALSGSIRIEGDPDAVRAVWPGLVPDGVAGTVVIDVAPTGTLASPEARLEIAARGIALPGAPDALGLRPVEATGVATWDAGRRRLLISGLTVRRGEANLAGQIEVLADGPVVSAVLRGPIEAAEVTEFLPDGAAPLRPGRYEVEAVVDARRAGGAWSARLSPVEVRREGLFARFTGEVSADGPAVAGTLEVEGRAETVRAALNGADRLPGDIAAVFEVGLRGDQWTVSGEAGLARSDGAPLLPDVPEVGSRWRLSGAVRGTTDLGRAAATGLRIRLGGTELTVVEATIVDATTSHRRGDLVVRWDDDLRAKRPLRPFALRARSAGEARVEVRGRQVTITGDTRFHDLVLTVQDRPEIRAANLRVATNLDLDADGTIALRSLLAESSDLSVDANGRIDDLFGTPTGTFGGTFRADTARARPWLPPVEGLAPTGVIEGRLEVNAARDEIRVNGTITSPRIAASDESALEDLEITLDAAMPRDVGQARWIRADRLELRAKDMTASVRGRLDLTGERPGFVGRAIAHADLRPFAPLLERIGRPAEGYVMASLDAEGREQGEIEVVVERLRLPLPETPFEPAFEEETVQVTATLAWPLGARLPRIRQGSVRTPWTRIMMTGDLDPSGPLDMRVTADVDLPALLVAHRDLFPDGSKARGRTVAELTVAGDWTAPRTLAGKGTLTVERFTMPGYDAKEGRLDLTLADAILTITEAAAKLNGGPAKFVGEVDAREETPVLSGDFETTDIRLVRKMEPQARYVNPVFALATELSGTVTAKGSLEARGKTSDEWKRTLLGEVDLTVADGRVAGSPLVGTLFSLLKSGSGSSEIDLDDLSTRLRFADGRLATEDMRMKAGNVEIRFRGMTGLADQAIDYVVRVKLPGDDDKLSPWLRVLDPEGYIPLRLGGTLTSPRLQPPEMADVGRNVLEDLLKRALEKAGEKKKRKKDKKDRKKEGR